MPVQLQDPFAGALGDRYRVERELGRGGMATVYLARDLKHDRDVAIKVLHPELGAALGSDRFLSEIRTTARLQHPHILPLLDSGEAGGRLYYVMPLVAGETLRSRLERERQLPVPDAVRMAREVASALDYAHRHGVIHRDIKPENILLHDGQVQVADFGIALAVQEAGGQRLTQTGLSLGTPQYMSPEQAMGERTIDARSDVYALGAVSYEMLTGEPPFTGATIQQIVARLMAEEPRPLTVQRKSIPEAVEAAVLRALDKIPADRFSTAAEFAAALDFRDTPTVRTAAPRRPQSGRGLTVALASVAALSMAAALWAWTRPERPADVIRYRITIDSVPAVKNWAGETAISPDGAVIVRSGGQNGLLLIRRRDELAFSPLAGTTGAIAPFFSPDGSRIGYSANGTISAVPTAGGPPVVLIDSLGAPEAVAWGGDGYLYRTTLTAGTLSIVRSQPRHGAPVERVTVLDTLGGEMTHSSPHLLDDQKTLLFQIGLRDGRRVIGVTKVGTQGHRVLLPGTRARYVGGYLVFVTGDGKLWAQPFDPSTQTLSGTAVQVGEGVPATTIGPVDFAVSASGTLVYSVDGADNQRELTWVSRTGQRVPFAPGWTGEFSSPALSPDGSRIAVTVHTDGQSGIWVRNVNGGMPTKLSVEQRNSVEPAWSGDGRWVSYLAGAVSSLVGDVWRQPADGSGRAERVATSVRPLSEQTWSGNTLLVRTTTPTPGSGDILMLRHGIDTVLVPLIASERTEYSPDVSRDGKWIAWVSNETGRYEVYAASFADPGAGKWPISTAGGNNPRWSRSGNEIFYLDDRSNLVAVRVTTSPAFSVESARVLFNAADFTQLAVSRRNYDVAADDQRFLMVQRPGGVRSGQIVVVEHWLDEIRRTSGTRR